MLELNKIHLMDCLDGLKLMDDNSVDLAISSPPYNKGIKSRSTNSLWNSSIDYDTYDDNMSWDEYKQWQIDICNEVYRVLKPGGSFFYNHKMGYENNQCIFPWEWLRDCKLELHQLIVWDRGNSVNIALNRYIPSSEYVFWLTKGNENIRFQRQSGIKEVWRIGADVGNPHPAPFPLEIPNSIIPHVAMGERITVLDPFMGSGTTAVAAIQNHCNYIGFDVSEKYIAMANERIERAKSEMKETLNLFGDEFTDTTDSLPANHIKYNRIKKHKEITDFQLF